MEVYYCDHAGKWKYAGRHSVGGAHISQEELLGLAVTVFTFWTSRLNSILFGRNRTQQLRRSLRHVEDYAEWQERGLELDAQLGNDVWRANPQSRRYDHRLIMRRSAELEAARRAGDHVKLAFILGSGLIRNFGNISDVKLYNRSYVGTKFAVENYIELVCECLDEIYRSSSLSPQRKLDFFHDARQSYGSTALILHGGTAFGLSHIGVIKALWTCRLLPSIIVGTEVGAAIAALVCVRKDHELNAFLLSEFLDVIDSRNDGGLLSNLYTALTLFLRYGHIVDNRRLEELVHRDLGDMTFEEAFVRTNRTLNITVSTTSLEGAPTLLNYLTAPTITIASAVRASNAQYQTGEIDLLCKGSDGSIQPWAPKVIRWSPYNSFASPPRESPFTRLSELFNVNHFVISQAVPWVAPFLTSTLHRHKRKGYGLKFMRLLGMELMYRSTQLNRLGLLPSWISREIIDYEFSGTDLTVAPRLKLKDFQKLLVHRRDIQYWITRGQDSMWPAISLIQARCQIEMQLSHLYRSSRRSNSGRRSRRNSNDQPNLRSEPNSSRLQRGGVSSVQVSPKELSKIRVRSGSENNLSLTSNLG